MGWKQWVEDNFWFIFCGIIIGFVLFGEVTNAQMTVNDYQKEQAYTDLENAGLEKTDYNFITEESKDGYFYSYFCESKIPDLVIITDPNQKNYEEIASSTPTDTVAF